MFLTHSLPVAALRAAFLVLPVVPTAALTRAGGGETYPVSVPHARVHLGTFGRVVVLDANGDERADVATLLADRPVVAYDLANSQTTQTVGGPGASELAVFPGPVTDDLFVLRASGIERCTYHESANAGRPGYLYSDVLGSHFAGCSSLVVHDLDGDGFLDLSALAPGGASVVRAQGIGGGGFVPGAPLALAAPVSRVLALGWLGGSAYAMVSGSTLEVVAASGVTLDSFVFAAPIVDLASVVEPTVTSGALAVLTVAADGASAVTLLRAGGVAEPSVDLGALGAVGLHVGDIDGSGVDDIVVTGTADGALRVLRHRGALVPTYSNRSLDFVEVLDPTLDPSSQRANAVSADFDADGDVDLFLLAEATRGGFMTRNLTFAHGDQAPVALTSSIAFDGATPHVLADVHVLGLISGALPTHLEAELWAELPNGASYFPFGPSSFLMGAVSVPVDPLQPSELVRIDAPVAFGPRAWVSLRGVVRQAGTIVETGPDRILAFDAAPTDGGGTGGAEPQKGDGGTPPPKDITPIGG